MVSSVSCKKGEPKRQATCNQCGGQMSGCAIYPECCVQFCANPACPNYGFYQFSLEEIKILKDNDYKIK